MTPYLLPYLPTTFHTFGCWDVICCSPPFCHHPAVVCPSRHSLTALYCLHTYMPLLYVYTTLPPTHTFVPHYTTTFPVPPYRRTLDTLRIPGQLTHRLPVPYGRAGGMPVVTCRHAVSPVYLLNQFATSIGFPVTPRRRLTTPNRRRATPPPTPLPPIHYDAT